MRLILATALLAGLLLSACHLPEQKTDLGDVIAVDAVQSVGATSGYADISKVLPPEVYFDDRASFQEVNSVVWLGPADTLAMQRQSGNRFYIPVTGHALFSPGRWLLRVTTPSKTFEIPAECFPPVRATIPTTLRYPLDTLRIPIHATRGVKSLYYEMYIDWMSLGSPIGNGNTYATGAFEIPWADQDSGVFTLQIDWNAIGYTGTWLFFLRARDSLLTECIRRQNQSDTQSEDPFRVPQFLADGVLGRAGFVQAVADSQAIRVTGGKDTGE